MMESKQRNGTKKSKKREEFGGPFLGLRTPLSNGWKAHSQYTIHKYTCQTNSG